MQSLIFGKSLSNNQKRASKQQTKRAVIQSARGPKRFSVWGWYAKDLRLLFGSSLSRKTSNFRVDGHSGQTASLDEAKLVVAVDSLNAIGQCLFLRDPDLSTAIKQPRKPVQLLGKPRVCVRPVIQDSFILSGHGNHRPIIPVHDSSRSIVAVAADDDISLALLRWPPPILVNNREWQSLKHVAPVK